MRVVAEGVECIELLEVLNSLGCDFAQGYAISRPLPPDVLAQWLQTCEWAPKTHRGPSGKPVELARAV